MPRLEKITIKDFRNIEFQELEFSPNVNCISGGNGEGKTNLLDAIWYLSMTKSAFASSDQYNFRHGTKAFAISGRYRMENGTSSVFSISSEDGQKKVRRDDKATERISSHIGLLPIVMVSPSDNSMVSEAGEERRKFVNSVLSQMGAEYLSSVQKYTRLLAQRNQLLKSGTLAGLPDQTASDLLATYDHSMASLATPIFEARKKFIEGLLPLVQDYYQRISGGREAVDIEYRSCISDGRSLDTVLEEHRQQDLAMHYTVTGLQRDDFIFRMDGWPIRRCGSQGQQKSFLVALKFAQYDLMKESCGFPPILLLDDLFDKLDMSRVGNLLKMVAGEDFGQIFLTDSNKVRLNGMVDSITADRACFEAEAGSFTRTDRQ